MDEQLSIDSKEFAKRATVAGMYSQVMHAISRSRLTTEQIALRLGRDPETLRRKFNSSRGWTLNDVSDFMLAVHCEMGISVTDQADGSKS